MDNKVTAEFIKTCPDPDPEIERELEEMEALEEDIGADDLLLMAMGETCDAMSMVIDDVLNHPMTGVGVCEAAARIRDLAEITLRMHDRLMAGKTLEKLRFIKEVESRNDEIIKRWGKKDETLCKASAGDEGAERAQYGHCACAESE